MDSNVFISLRFPLDANHGRATEFLSGLAGAPRLTRSAGYEVAEITRSKLNLLVERIYADTDVLDASVDPAIKRDEVDHLLDKLEREQRLGTFLTLVRTFCQGEFERGHHNLDNLADWALDLSSGVVTDILRESGARKLEGLPGPIDDEDMEFIAACEAVIGKRPIRGEKDRRIFWDVIASSKRHDDIVFVTFDAEFAEEMSKAVAMLVDTGLLEDGAIRVVDLNRESP